MPIDNPAGTPVVGPGAPYITPALLTAASTGISWTTIPSRSSTAEQQLAEQLNMCVRSTGQIDAYCNQPLRATVDTEELTGPGDFRCQLQTNTGVTRLLMSRGPVLFVDSGRVSSAAAFPRSWTSIDGDQFVPDYPLIGVYGTSAPGASGGGGQAILLAPGWVTWATGRAGSRAQVTYVNGWPHAALTAAAAAGASTLTVDDITGWFNTSTGQGAAGNIYDTSSFQEFVSVTAVTPTTTGAISGPGTLTLASALVYPHSKGVLVSCLPGNVQLAGIYLCVAQALTRGATATAVQAISGGASGGGPQASGDYVKQAQELVHPYKRVI